MQGKRIYPNESGKLIFSEPGQYGKEKDGTWHATIPGRNWHNGLILGNLASHDVTEHEDGAITVSPSILVDYDDGKQWHGYLEHGIWREV